VEPPPEEGELGATIEKERTLFHLSGETIYGLGYKKRRWGTPYIVKLVRRYF